MQLINCTPHPINVLDESGKEVLTLPKGKIVPRLTQSSKEVSKILGVPITETVFGETTNLPEKKEGVFLIVSRLVMMANPNRNDLLVPNELVRDNNGNIIGCRSLSKN